MENKYSVLDTICYHTIDEVERAINCYCVLKLNRSPYFETQAITDKDIEAWGKTYEWRGSYLGISMLIEIQRKQRGGYTNEAFKRQRWLGATNLDTYRHDHYLGEIEISLLDNRDDMEMSQIINRPQSPVRLRITGCWPPFDSFWQGLAQFITGDLNTVIPPGNSSLPLHLTDKHRKASSEKNKQLEAEVLQTKLSGLFAKQKVLEGNLNGLQIEEAKHGTINVPLRLKWAIDDVKKEIIRIETEIQEVKAQLAVLDIE